MSERNWDLVACEMWDILVARARARKSTTYSEISEPFNLFAPGLSPALNKIQDYCLRGDCPPLNILVVNKETGIPGSGFSAAPRELLDEYRRLVFEYDWERHGNPFEFARDGTSELDLARSILDSPDRAEAVYRRVQDRGVAQPLFRTVLLDAYKGHCAFSGSNLTEALDAAHIVPWGLATASERLSPRNGLLLNAYYHRLFDARVLILKEDFTLQLRAGVDLSKFSEHDSSAIGPLLGERIRYPRHRDYAPLAEYVRRRYAD